jgi:regulator of protease activity HflC (stomatin/prohibitin superfamily)
MSGQGQSDEARVALLRDPSAPPPAQQMELQAHTRPNDDDLMAQQARSPAYRALVEAGLVSNKYRCESTTQLSMTAANSSRGQNCLVLPCLTPCVSTFTVPQGKVRCAEDGQGKYFFYGPGVHWVNNPWVKLGDFKSLSSDRIQHGNLAIVVVPQGFIGYAMDRGQPLLLPPGMHYWESDTITFQKNIDLSEPVINMGPYTLVTVDEGYSAVTQNNGRQVCLRGGQVYLLTHRNWKFEKFMSEKVQTDDIPMQTMSTADNVLLSVSATVTWMIKDVETAARCAADTMYTGTSANDVSMPTLRNDVMKQALASLSAFIGSVRYSESFGISTAASTLHNPPTAPVEPEAEAGCRGLFDDEARKHLQTAVDHCNEVTIRYGVVVTSVNIISAMPKDDQLIRQLAAAAVAAAEAERLEIEASGKAKATTLAARADADAARERARGAKDAADTLRESDVAVEMERIRCIGNALGDKSTMFFGASAGDVDKLMSNPAVVRR